MTNVTPKTDDIHLKSRLFISYNKDTEKKAVYKDAYITAVGVRIEEHKAFKVCGRKVWIIGQDDSQFASFWEKAHASGMVQKLKGAKGLSRHDAFGLSQL